MQAGAQATAFSDPNIFPTFDLDKIKPLESSTLIEERQKFIRSLIFPSLFLFLIWLVKLIELVSEQDFYIYGIYPRELYGIKGIFLAPFLHSGMNHLIDNSVPLFLLMIALFYFYHEIAIKVFVLSFLITNIMVWLGARASFHIGASGLIYSFASFLFFSGIIRRYARLVAISLLVVFLYGGLVWGLLPFDMTISFETHIYGAIVGLVLSFFYKEYGPQREIYSWEKEDDESTDLPWDVVLDEDDESKEKNDEKNN
jgi:membrane associated rhomboid family serine protease